MTQSTADRPGAQSRFDVHARQVPRVAPEGELLLHQAVGQVSPDAALLDERQIRLALDGAKAVDNVVRRERFHTIRHNVRQQGTVIVVDVEIAVRVIAKPRPLGVQPISDN